MSSPFEVLFLRDVKHGGPTNQLVTVASDLAEFISTAHTSVDVAIYDFRLSDPDAVKTVVGALTGAADRGVAVRIAFDAGKPDAATAADFAALGGDPAPPGTADWVQSHFAGSKVEVKAIAAGGQLMHSKYVLRDAPADRKSAGATSGTVSSEDAPAVWTGSTNFTDDAWTRQENNIITITDPVMAASYRVDFQQMWSQGKIAGSGKGGAGGDTPAGVQVGWDFCPGDGAAVNAALAARVAAATTRLVVATMVLTSHEVLTALSEALDRGVTLSGIYDGGQMDPIVAGWKKSSSSAAVLANWHKVSAHLARKQSTPYRPTSTHDFMHLKVLISDDIVTTGSYNFSANAERNAENQLHLNDPATVAAYDAYVRDVVSAYS